MKHHADLSEVRTCVECIYLLFLYRLLKSIAYYDRTFTFGYENDLISIRILAHFALNTHVCFRCLQVKFHPSHDVFENGVVEDLC